MMPYMNQNPNYYQQYMQPQYQMPVQNPYMDRLNQFQNQQVVQPQVQNQFPALGKVVEGIEIVKTTDIPMDGNMYYFPTADGSTVFGKQWMSNGQTRILTFKPVLEGNPNNSPTDDVKIQFGAFGEVLDGIQNDLRTLSDKVDRLNKPEKVKKGGSDE